MFGFQAKNTFGDVTLNSEFPTLVFSERGQVIVENTSVVDRPAVGGFNFKNIKTQIAPPKIFLRFNSGRHASCLIYLAMNGGPGDWTGVTIYAGALGGGVLPRHVIDYVVCETSSSILQEDYGMVIYDSSGKPTYKSEDSPVKYNKFTNTWGTSFIDEFNYIYFPLGITIGGDEFIDISSMNRGNVFMNFYSIAYTGAYILRGGVRTLQLLISLGNTGSQVISPNGIQFCMPICKFPNDIYTNT